MKPFSEACERNRGPILAVLKKHFSGSSRVLEIGSGTGQHAAYFAPALAHLVWQPSDVQANLAGIRQWVEEAAAPNLRAPVVLDVDAWTDIAADAVFSANTCHILSWPRVERMFSGVARVLPENGMFCLYGPFRYAGRHTSESNAHFDAMLRGRDPLSGVRDAQAIFSIAEREYLAAVEDTAMPANNRLLVFRKQAGG